MVITMKLSVLTNPFEFRDKILSQDGVFFCFNKRTSKSNKSEIGKFEKIIGFELPNEMVDMYSQSKSINLLWHYRKEGMGMINGRCWLHGPYSFNRGFFNARKPKKEGEKLKNHLWTEKMDAEWVHYLESKYFILDFICLYSNTFVLLNFEGDSSNSPKLTLFMYPNFLFPLKLTFNEYLYWMDKTRAMHTWMEHFIDKEKCSVEALEYLKIMRPGRFFANMKLVFPDLELNEFPKNEKSTNYSFESLAIRKNYFNRLIETSRIFFERKPADSMFKIPETGIWTREIPFVELVSSPLNIFMVRKIELCIERELPDSMLAFYSQINGFTMEWSISKDSEFCEDYEMEDKNYLFGNFKFYGLHEVFGGPNSIDTFYWDRDNWPGAVSDPINMSDEELLFANSCFLIYGSEFNNVVIRFEEGQIEPDLYLCEYLNEHFFHRLSLTFEEFIELLFENMGLQYWIRFFIEDEEDAREIIKKSPNVPRIVKKLNPRANLSKYRSK